MQMIPIDALRPEAGTALRWHPTAQSAAAAASSAAHDGPTTFLTENHVRASLSAAAAGRPHRAFIGTATDVDGDLDTDAMTKALTSFVQRHRALRLWFDDDAATHVVDCAAIEFEIHDDGPLTTRTQTATYLHHCFEQETPSTSFPGFAFGAIARTGSFSVFFACDHGLTDGVSQALALGEILGIYEECRTDTQPDDDEYSTGGDYLDYAALESTATTMHAAGSPQTEAWVDIFARHAFRMPRFPLDLGMAPDETAPVAPVRAHVLDGDGVEAFTRMCREAGGKLIDGIYAAIATTDRELAGVERYFGMTVLNTRAVSPEFATAQGWFCAFAPVEFGVADATSVRELIGTARSARTRARELGSVPPAAALGALAAEGLPLDEVMSAPNLLSYIDFRWFPGNGSPAYDRAVMFTGEGRTRNASMWVNCDDDELYIGSQAPDTPFAREQVVRYLDHLSEVIRSVTRDGDRGIGGQVTSAATVMTGAATVMTGAPASWVR